MRLTDLNIHHLRNISSATLQFHPQCNLFYGANGSGKTSLLEAIYLLSSGHSFRTREISPLVTYDEASLVVFARTSTDESISIQKSINGPTQVKINQQLCQSSSELAHFLPCQVFYQDIFQIIDAGPAVRRMLLDWGLFHVEPSYHSVWKNYRSVLKQRNALLRQKAKPSYFVPWDEQLVALALDLDRMRASYFSKWVVAFQRILPLLTDLPCTIEYYKGWDKKGSDKGLADILNEHFSQDIQRQYTYAGAHQADVFFDLSSKKAKLLLSRGQQKIVLIALKLAQATLMPKSCIYIAAELDSFHLSRLVDYWRQLKGQIFLTAVDEAAIKLFQDALELKSHTLQHGVFA
jgi:DNA replication and repair protein RecF